jgi:hypothetical protein
MDPLTVLETLATGIRRTPSSDADLGDLAARDWFFADILTSLMAPSPTTRSSRLW